MSGSPSSCESRFLLLLLLPLLVLAGSSKRSCQRSISITTTTTNTTTITHDPDPDTSFVIETIVTKHSYTRQYPTQQSELCGDRQNPLGRPRASFLAEPINATFNPAKPYDPYNWGNCICLTKIPPSRANLQDSIDNQCGSNTCCQTNSKCNKRGLCITTNRTFTIEQRNTAYGHFDKIHRMWKAEQKRVAAAAKNSTIPVFFCRTEASLTASVKVRVDSDCNWSNQYKNTTCNTREHPGFCSPATTRSERTRGLRALRALKNRMFIYRQHILHTYRFGLERQFNPNSGALMENYCACHFFVNNTYIATPIQSFVANTQCQMQGSMCGGRCAVDELSGLCFAKPKYVNLMW